jgi:hypothetical protein
LALVKDQLAAVAEHAHQLAAIQSTIDLASGPSALRRERFDALAAELTGSLDPARQHMARVMTSFAPGLFAAGDDTDIPVDNLALERAFRLPKGHERRIHGHAHAGVRIVQRGATLLLVLDAHARHPAPFSPDDLAPWADVRTPPCLEDCLRRRRIMRRARSAKRRPLLLADLERRYREAVMAL